MSKQWTYELDADGDHAIFDGRGRLVAVTSGFAEGSASPWSKEEDAANARLIAAAPQMLEALKHLTGFIADLRNVYSNDAAEFIMNKPSYKAAADAIKLAEGE